MRPWVTRPSHSAAGANGGRLGGLNGQPTKPIDPNLPCARCGHLRPQTAFAKNRLICLRMYGMVPKDSPGMKQLICIECAGGQVTELPCKMCLKTKGLDEFSQAQRKTPDSATCLLCMDERLKTEPGHMKDEKKDRKSESETFGHLTSAASSSLLSGGGVSLHGTKEYPDDDEYAPRNSTAAGRTSRAPISTTQTAGNSSIAFSSARSAGRSIGSGIGMNVPTTNVAANSGWARPPRREAPVPAPESESEPESYEEDVADSSDDEENPWNM